MLWPAAMCKSNSGESPVNPQLILECNNLDLVESTICSTSICFLLSFSSSIFSLVFSVSYFLDFLFDLLLIDTVF